jgi:lipopolysaccharide/colanic/teichoic acid biosynthesis glycosyltransferase
MMKRVVDLVAASIIMILLSPLFLVIAIGVRLSSPGSIFYRQERIGRDGRPFHMFKFRTMFNGSSSSTHREHVQNLIINDISPADLGKASLKLNDDPRITPFGRWLRTLSLDEMPQFINVLRGEMSIVGPRPPVAYEYELYSNWHKQRMLVLPGITGLWQVTAHNQVSFNEMVEIDLDYIRKMDLWLDLKIMIMTPLEMLSGKGGG